MASGDIVDAVEQFFYEDEDFAGLFETFAKKHAHRIDLKNEEFKLEYTDIYNEFQELFEKTLSEFITSRGSTVKEFYLLLRDAFEEDEEGERAIFAQIMTATTDFDVFMQLMRDTAEEMPQEAREAKTAAADSEYSSKMDDGGGGGGGGDSSKK